jgi:hypothetical protein
MTLGLQFIPTNRRSSTQARSIDDRLLPSHGRAWRAEQRKRQISAPIKGLRHPMIVAGQECSRHLKIAGLEPLDGLLSFGMILEDGRLDADDSKGLALLGNACVVQFHSLLAISISRDIEQ